MPGLQIWIDARRAATGAAEFDAEAKKVQASATGAARGLDAVSASSEKASKSTNKASVSARSGAAAQKALGGSAVGSSAGMDKAAVSANRLTASVNGLGVGLVRGAKGFGAIAIGLAAFKAATTIPRILADTEQGLVGVGKTTGIAGDELKALGVSLTDLSTRLPISTSRLLEVAQSAGQLGVKGSANILKFAETLARLESASNLVGEEGATALARILNVTGESIRSVDVLGSVIVRLGNNFAATESEIASSATRIAAAGAIYGITASQAAALGAAFVATGTEAELSGSTIARAFDVINGAVRQGGNELEVLAAVSGKTGESIREAFLGGESARVLQDFLTGLGQVEDSSAVLETLGLTGVRVVPTLQKLALNSEILGSAMSQAADEVSNATALVNESNLAFDTLGSATKNLGNAFSAIVQDGIGFNDVLKDLLNSTADVVKSISRVGTVSEDAGVGVRAIAASVETLAVAMGISFGANAIGSLNKWSKAMALAALQSRITSAAVITQVSAQGRLRGSVLALGDAFKTSPIIAWTGVIAAAAFAVRELSREAKDFDDARKKATDSRSIVERFGAGAAKATFAADRGDNAQLLSGQREKADALSEFIDEALANSSRNGSDSLVRFDDLASVVGSVGLSKDDAREALIQGMIEAGKAVQGGSPLDVARAIQLQGVRNAILPDGGPRVGNGTLDVSALRTPLPKTAQSTARGFFTGFDPNAPITDGQIEAFARKYAEEFDLAISQASALPLLQDRLDLINRSIGILEEKDRQFAVPDQGSLQEDAVGDRKEIERKEESIKSLAQTQADAAEQLLRDADAFQRANKLFIESADIGVVGLGSASADALLGVRSFGEGLNDVLRSMIHNLIAATIEAQVLKNVVGPLLSSRGASPGVIGTIFPALAGSGASAASAASGARAIAGSGAGAIGSGAAPILLASGGLFPEGRITGPTDFLLAGGRRARAGEAGSEVGFRENGGVAPLVTDPRSGKMGVAIVGSGGGTSVTTNQFNVSVTVPQGTSSRGMRMAGQQIAENARRALGRKR